MTMAQYTDIIRSLSPDKFAEILAASARKSREVYFDRHAIRAPKSASKLPKAGAKNEFRTAQLFAALKETDDEELAQEMLRTWLLGKRQLLCAALDHLKIPHEDGLTESDDVDKMAELKGAELAALVEALKSVATADEIVVYLKFMGVEGADSAIS
jgi:hypothetical protein